MNYLKLLMLVLVLVSCRNSTIVHTDYHSNGNKRMEVELKDGLLHGSYTIWFENGKKQVETTFANDTIFGNFKMWFSDGRLAYDVDFRDEELASTITLGKKTDVVSAMEKKLIYGWLKYEAEQLKVRLKQQNISYYKIKCLLFNSFVYKN